MNKAKSKVYEAIVQSWNSGADEFNQWDTLGGEEMVKFAIEYLGRKDEELDKWWAEST